MATRLEVPGSRIEMKNRITATITSRTNYLSPEAHPLDESSTTLRVVRSVGSRRPVAPLLKTQREGRNGSAAFLSSPSLYFREGDELDEGMSSEVAADFFNSLLFP